MHIHLDLVGGLSGDMFLSAMLDCFPDETDHLQDVLVQAGFAELVAIESGPHDDGVLTGTQTRVIAGEDAQGHHHRHYSEIQRIIGDSKLTDGVKQHALGIFELIAEVEARIHGKEVSKVAFHEVGAWDSIADIVCAAYLVDRVDASWSVSTIPTGSGTVQTAHGPLPIPAPATARLLEGFELKDDGIAGERVTPTGAAILKHLSPSQTLPSVGALQKSGYGFGAKQFPGISNVVRAMVFESEGQATWKADQVVVLEFDIDDQTPEQLARALDRLRSMDGVIDIVQQALIGKKGRISTGVRVMLSPDAEQSVTGACFELTTTLGIRRQQLDRRILKRTEVTVDHEGRKYRVKVAFRPGGATAKVDIDDLADESQRQLIEDKALALAGIDANKD